MTMKGESFRYKDATGMEYYCYFYFLAGPKYPIPSYPLVILFFIFFLLTSSSFPRVSGGCLAFLVTRRDIVMKGAYS